MRAFIYTGGQINAKNITEQPTSEDITIAADSGYENAKLLGIKPDVLLGDFDSIARNELNGVPTNTEIITLPAKKDFTDTHFAVETALQKGANEIIIIGGLGGRLDHTLSNLAILEDMYASKIRAIITSGDNRARYLKNDSIIIMNCAYKYISLLARDEKVKGVTIEGCKYPLKNATLTSRYQYAVSNEIDGNCTFISVRKGGLLIVESNDKL